MTSFLSPGGGPRGGHGLLLQEVALVGVHHVEDGHGAGPAVADVEPPAAGVERHLRALLLRPGGLRRQLVLNQSNAEKMR